MEMEETSKSKVKMVKKQKTDENKKDPKLMKARITEMEIILKKNVKKYI